MYRQLRQYASRRLLITFMGLCCSLLPVTPLHGQKAVESSATCPPYFRDLGPLGGETPREVAERFLKGVVEGNGPQIVSSFDLSSLESLGTAAMYAETAKATALARKLDTRIRERFGERGVRALADQLDLRWSGTDEFVPFDDVEELLSKMEIITEGDQSVTRIPSPWGSGDWLRLRKSGGRWYVMPPQEAEARPGADVTAVLIAGYLEQSLSQLQQIEKAVENSESVDEFEEQLGQFDEAKEGSRVSPGMSDDSRPRYPDAMLWFEHGASSGRKLWEGPNSAGFGAGSEDYGYMASFVGRSTAGDVYVIRIKTPEGQQEPEAFLYSGGEKVLYESEDGKARIWIEPASGEISR